MLRAALMFVGLVQVPEPLPTGGVTASVFAEPSAPPPRRIVEQGPSPLYYRTRRDTIGFGYRLGLGASVSLASPLPRSPSRFTLDLLPELDFGFARGSKFGGLLQGGYSYTQSGTHLFVIGAGPAARHFGPTFNLGKAGTMTAALVGHAVVGTVAGRTSAGGRASVLLHAWLLGIELGYQYLGGQQGGHELRLMVAIGAMGYSR